MSISGVGHVNPVNYGHDNNNNNNNNNSNSFDRVLLLAYYRRHDATAD